MTAAARVCCCVVQYYTHDVQLITVNDSYTYKSSLFFCAALCETALSPLMTYVRRSLFWFLERGLD